MAQQINLFDPALQRRRDWLALTNVVVAGLLLSVGVGVAGFAARTELPTLTTQVATTDAQVKILRDQITALGQQATSRKPDARLEQELGAAKLLLEARGDVLGMLKQQLSSASVPYADYLRGFARQSLPGLWLTGFAFNAASSGMEIEGRVTDPALLPEYIRRLNREPAFQGRAFASLQLTEGKIEPVPGAAPSLTAVKQAAFHDFKLVPLRPVVTTAGDKPAALTQLPSPTATGGPG